MKAARYNPIAGRAYKPLPPFLAKKKSIINIKNPNEKCFGYCLAAFFLNQEREHAAEVDRTDVSSSMSTDLCFITNTAERNANKISSNSTRNRFSKRSFSNPGGSNKT